ncbi:hypothetical protein NGUA33_03769 [Salmonella enterica]|nr:hypothetical protein NGUA33_03769 [Salmonella enterica]
MQYWWLAFIRKRRFSLPMGIADMALQATGALDQ